jgi:lysophospholipase L1-like esterase
VIPRFKIPRGSWRSLGLTVAPFAAILLFGFTPALRAQAPGKALAHDAYWREKKSFFDTFHAPAAVVMVGDSLTDGAEWRELFPGVSIANRGIDGDTAQGVLERLEGIVALHPAKAFVMIGINDFVAGKSVDAVFGSYGRIVAKLREGGAAVFVQSTLMCNAAKAAWTACAAANEKVAQLNARLAALGAPGVTFVDLNKTLAGTAGLKSALTFDGVHLNGEGYRLWRDAIAPYVLAP